MRRNAALVAIWVAIPTHGSLAAASGCGSKGGPGYRKTNGKCASWKHTSRSRRGPVKTLPPSPSRFVRQSLGVKSPRGYGWLTNPKRALYTRVYNRTTFSLGSLVKSLFGGKR